MLERMSDVTRILSAIEQGDPHAAEQLLPVVYEELRQLAVVQMAQEKPGQTLDATALVHEAYLRLVGELDVNLTAAGIDAHFERDVPVRDGAVFDVGLSRLSHHLARQSVAFLFQTGRDLGLLPIRRLTHPFPGASGVRFLLIGPAGRSDTADQRRDREDRQCNGWKQYGAPHSGFHLRDSVLVATRPERSSFHILPKSAGRVPAVIVTSSSRLSRLRRGLTLSPTFKRAMRLIPRRHRRRPARPVGLALPATSTSRI